MNSETQRDSSVILRLTRDLQPENLRPLQVGEVQEKVYLSILFHFLNNPNYQVLKYKYETL